MPLNINLQQILLHALNFVILFGAMYFLLYYALIVAILIIFVL